MKAHPYADAWPMLGEDDLTDLAEDIRLNGLRDAIVIYDGMILDGRNRFAACEHAEVEPRFIEFDGDDDAALAFVQSVNNARRHQSKGSLAASWALSMLAAGKRVNGRWKRDSLSTESGISAQRATETGLIADFAPELLVEVRDELRSLNSAHQEAELARKAADDHRAEVGRIEVEEAEALAALPAEYAKKIGDTYSSARVAFAAWEDANRAEAARLRKKREAAERAKRDHAEGMKREAGYLSTWITTYGFAANFRNYPHRDEVLAAMLPKYRDEFLATEAANDWKMP